MDETQQYLAAIGQQVLRQAAEQQPEPRPTAEQIQQRHIQQRRRAEQQRMIDEARAKAARLEAERLREASDQKRIMDVLEENRIMNEEKQRFMAVLGNLEEDFDRMWPSRWAQLQVERVEAQKRRSAAYNAF